MRQIRPPHHSDIFLFGVLALDRLPSDGILFLCEIFTRVSTDIIVRSKWVKFHSEHAFLDKCLVSVQMLCYDDTSAVAEGDIDTKKT